MIRYEKTDLEKTQSKQDHDKIRDAAFGALNTLKNADGPGNEFLGWMDLPLQSMEELRELNAVAKEIQESGDMLICIGIGGSYLGSKAVISSLYPDNKTIRFAGHHLSPLELTRLVKELETKDFYINVISKSGTTTEPGVAFRILRELSEKKYGPDSSKRIIATTDEHKGALRILADEKGYRTFVIPDNVGGRFSVLTAVGLLPILAAGADLEKILTGAKCGLERSLSEEETNPALAYAINRNYLYRNGKAIEIMASFEPQLHFVAEWWKQLFGESEGKDGKGLFPASVNFTTDLHSMGQWIQDGVRIIFETFLIIENYEYDLIIPEDSQNLDGLNFIAGKTLSYVNKKAFEGTMAAHRDGAVPSTYFILETLSEESLFELFTIFEVAVAISGYMLGVNPFDQPGVEAYKTNMFKLLGKPGF